MEVNQNIIRAGLQKYVTTGNVNYYVVIDSEMAKQTGCPIPKAWSDMFLISTVQLLFSLLHAISTFIW